MFPTIREIVLMIATILLALIAELGISWWKPRLGPIGFDIARNSPYESRMILNQSISSGGYLL